MAARSLPKVTTATLLAKARGWTNSTEGVPPSVEVVRSMLAAAHSGFGEAVRESLAAARTKSAAVPEVVVEKTAAEQPPIIVNITTPAPVVTALKTIPAETETLTERDQQGRITRTITRPTGR